MTDLVQRHDVLEAFYGCARVEVLPDPLRGNRAAVVLHRLLLPPSHPYPVQGGQRCLLPTSAYRPLPLGVDASGREVALQLFDETHGGTSVLIGGVPGAGKSNALRGLLTGLASTCAAVVVIDPTGGAEAGRWSARLSDLVTSADADETNGLLHRILDLIELRGRFLGAGGPPTLLVPLVLVCDELAELAAAGTAKQQDEARTMLRRIVALGRKAHVTCVLATQRTTAASIDVTTRSIAAWRIALAHPDDVYGSEALLGPGRRQAAALRKEDRGAAYLTDGGPPRLVRIYRVDDSVVSDMAATLWALSMGDLMGLEKAALRELTSRERSEDREDLLDGGSKVRTVAHEPPEGVLPLGTWPLGDE